MKHLYVEKETHKEVKDYCLGRNLKITGTIDKIILEGVRVLKIKEETSRAI